jgi:hypothetical protein
MPRGTDLGPVIGTGGVAAVSGALCLLSLAVGDGAGLWLLVEFITGVICLCAVVGLFGFGVAATLRRGAWVALVLRFVLTPLFYFFWALYKRRAERRMMSGET